MDISGTYLIPSDRASVWKAINDPDVLMACIPGCEELKPVEEAEGGGFAALVIAKIGPVKASFRGAVRLANIVEGHSYTIAGEGKGGAAGFAKLASNVILEDTDDGGTRLSYTADAQLGGKLAQLGSRLIEGTARKYADDFFARLTARLTSVSVLSNEDLVSEQADAAADSEGWFKRTFSLIYLIVGSVRMTTSGWWHRPKNRVCDGDPQDER